MWLPLFLEKTPRITIFLLANTPRSLPFFITFSLFFALFLPENWVKRRRKISFFYCFYLPNSHLDYKNCLQNRAK